MSQAENHQIAASPNQSMLTIGVVGAGQMGHGIAHVMLRAGHSVILLDTSQAFVEAGAKRIIKGSGARRGKRAPDGGTAPSGGSRG